MGDKVTLNTYVGANYQYGFSGPSASHKKGLDIEVGQDLLKLGDDGYKALGASVDFLSNSTRTGFFPAAAIAFGDKESAVVRLKAGPVIYTQTSDIDELNAAGPVQEPNSVVNPRVELSITLGKVINFGIATDIGRYGIDVMGKAGVGFVF